MMMRMITLVFMMMMIDDDESVLTALIDEDDYGYLPISSLQSSLTKDEYNSFYDNEAL